VLGQQRHQQGDSHPCRCLLYGYGMLKYPWYGFNGTGPTASSARGQPSLPLPALWVRYAEVSMLKHPWYGINGHVKVTRRPPDAVVMMAAAMAASGSQTPASTRRVAAPLMATSAPASASATAARWTGPSARPCVCSGGGARVGAGSSAKPGGGRAPH